MALSRTIIVTQPIRLAGLVPKHSLQRKPKSIGSACANPIDFAAVAPDFGLFNTSSVSTKILCALMCLIECVR